MIGMELGVSIASATLRHEATGAPASYRADVVAVAKKDLAVGEVLDGEGGYTVRGVLTTAERSLQFRALPMGLGHGLTVTRPVAAGSVVTWDDVTPPADSAAVSLRRELEEQARARLTTGGSA
jgi:predicted homoserine dehydrogenase-like protein